MESGPLSFSSPASQKVGDTILMLLLFPIFLAVLVFLLAIPAAGLVYGLGLGSEAQRFQLVVAAAVVPALLLAVVSLRTKLCWFVQLLDDGLRLGSLFPRRIAYEQVRFIRAGEASKGREDRAVVPLRIEAGFVAGGTIWLQRQQAQQCLEALHPRCPRAAAMDLKGKELLPSDPLFRETGVRRLVRFYLAVGIPMFVGGLLGVGIVGYFVFVAVIEGDHWDAVELAQAGAGGLAGVSAGWLALRKSRRVQRKARNRR